MYTPATLGEVYRPVEEILPSEADQVTAVLLVPLTVAVNCWVTPRARDAVPGAIETETGPLLLLTVTLAEADLVLSAELVAFTV